MDFRTSARLLSKKVVVFEGPFLLSLSSKVAFWMKGEGEGSEHAHLHGQKLAASTCLRLGIGVESKNKSLHSMQPTLHPSRPHPKAK